MKDQRLGEGIRHFNEGDYLRAHEVWEELWKEKQPSREKDLVKGLIMTAAALLHYRRKEYAGTSKLAARVLEILGGLKGVPLEINVEALLGEFSLFMQKLRANKAISEKDLPTIKEHARGGSQDR